MQNQGITPLQSSWSGGDIRILLGVCCPPIPEFPNFTPHWRKKARPSSGEGNEEPPTASHPPEHRDPRSPSVAPGASPGVPGAGTGSRAPGGERSVPDRNRARRGRSRREGNKSKLHQCWHGQPSRRAISGRARPAAGISICRCCLERLAGAAGGDSASVGTRPGTGWGPSSFQPHSEGTPGRCWMPGSSPWAAMGIPSTATCSGQLGDSARGDTRGPLGGRDVVASQGDWQGQGKRNLAVAMVTT